MSQPTTGQKFLLRNFSDVYAIGDVAVIERCMLEMLHMLKVSLHTQNLLNATAEALAAKEGESFTPVPFKFPDEIEWCDDGDKSEVTFVDGSSSALRVGCDHTTGEVTFNDMPLPTSIP